MSKKFVKGKRVKSHKGCPNKDPNSFKPGKNDNDVQWYTKYPKLVEANSSLIFNTRYGTAYNTEIFESGGTFTNQNSVPGCILLAFRSTLARAGLDADAVNVASKNLYTFVRHANSGSANYESSDLMQYIITVIHLGMELEQCKRTLRLAMTFNPLNKYVYGSMLSAEGWDAAAKYDLYTNNASYVGYVNTLIAKINSFKVPRDIAIADKLEWMVTNIFKDDQLEKCSYYMYENYDHVHYDWANRTVTFTQYPVSGPQILKDRLDRINSELDNLLAYEDIGIMLGDILKAYKAENCRVWSPMSLGEVQDSSYSEEVLLQMVNSIAFPEKDVFSIKQINSNSQLLAIYDGSNTTPGVLKTTLDSTVMANMPITSFEFNPLMCVSSDNPTNEDVIIGTRNMLSIEVAKDSTNKYVGTIYNFPNTIIVEFRVLRFDDGNYQIIQNVTSLNFVDQSNYVDFVNIVKLAAFKATISKFPNVYVYSSDGISSDANILFAGKNNQVIDSAWLRRLHDGCTLSEFSMPMFKLLESN